MSRTVRVARAVTTDVRKTGADPVKPRRHLAIKVETDDFVVIPPSKPGPEGWLETYKGIEKMRAEGPPAPVDLMGCASLSDPRTDPKVIRFQVLVGLMLSAMTKDAITSAAFKRLDSTLPGGLTVASMAAASQDTIEKLIVPVGFFRRKAGYLIATAIILQSKYHGDIPPTLKELCALPGVGPKMAHLCLQVAWGKVQGIGVDVHMHRIFNRLGWVNTKTPEQTRMSMEEWLPMEYWDKVNRLVVGFGQLRCSAIKPKCEGCLVRERCPFGRSQTTSTAKKVKKEKINAKLKQEKLKQEEKPKRVKAENVTIEQKVSTPKRNSIKKEKPVFKTEIVKIEQKEPVNIVKLEDIAEIQPGSDVIKSEVSSEANLKSKKKRRTMTQLREQQIAAQQRVDDEEEEEVMQPVGEGLPLLEAVNTIARSAKKAKRDDDPE